MREMFKTGAKFGEKPSKAAFDATDISTGISSRWTKDALARMGDVATVKDEPVDYTKAMTDFASTWAEHIAAFTEVAKKVRMETAEPVMAAGEAVSKDIGAAASKRAAAAK